MYSKVCIANRSKFIAVQAAHNVLSQDTLILIEDRVNYSVSKVDFGKIFECLCCKFLSAYVYKIKVEEKY